MKKTKKRNNIRTPRACQLKKNYMIAAHYHFFGEKKWMGCYHT